MLGEFALPCVCLAPQMSGLFGCYVGTNARISPGTHSSI